MKKRLLSAFMALALCLTLLPAPTWAAEADAPEGGAPAADEQPAVQSEPAPQAAEVSAENAVAQVGNVNYANITDAFAAVKENGGTLTLLADCKTPNTSEEFDISGNYTLDLNSCTLTGRLKLSGTSTSLTVKDSGTGGKIQATAGWSPLWVYGGTVTIESGTLATETEKGKALVFGYTAACGTLTIKGGVFKTGYVQIGDTGGTTVITGGAFHDLRVNGDYSNQVTLSGGTFDTVTRRKSGSTIAPTDLLADGYAFVNRNTGEEVSTLQEAALTNVKVVSKKTVNALASLTVNGTATPYGTFEEALDAAQRTQGGTLTLLNHVTTTQTDINSGTFTLDLNGHTLTSGYYNTLVVFGGSLTIQDSQGGGVISSTISDGRAVYCCGGNVTILGGSFPSALYWESGTVSLRGGEFRSLDSKAGSWLSAIPEGEALVRDDDHSVVDASAKTIHTADGFYVLADHEKHDWQAGKCACGREHTDHTWEDGKCTVCHLPCSHGTIDGDGVCETCGTQFTVLGDDGNYYKHLADALAEPFVDDVTLVADDTLSEDVTLIQDIFFYPNGHTVSGGGSIVVPSGKRLVLNKTGNAGAIRVKDGGTLMVDEDFTGTVQTLTVSETADVKLSGGTYGTITGSRQKAGTLLYNDNNHALAFQKQDGSFARYDQRISSETLLENVTVVGCPDKQLTEACGETCEYCGGALRCRIGAAGYRDMSDAIRDVPDGGTITLLRDYSAVNNISANVDRAYTIDLNGHSVRKDSGGISLAVYAGTPKIIDSKGGGVIAGLEIDSKLGLTLADLLPEGYTFKSGSAWISDLSGTELTNVSMAKIPIKSMNYPTEMSMTYGGAGTLLVTVAKETGTGAVNFRWYKVEDGKETAVGSATTSNRFDLSAQNLSAGQHTFRFSATCDGYEKMSKDIVVTVQRANISASLITSPTARENLTYTGQEQALITAGIVTSGGTMRYSLTENGTYSQDIPTGTDAGTYTVWYRVIGDANHNDTAPASVAVSIGKKPLTLTKVTAVSKPYDGTTNAGITSVTFDGVTLIRGTDYNVTASFEDASVGNNKMVTAAVTLIGQAAKNYALEQSSFPTTGNITKAAAPAAEAGSLTITNGLHETYSLDLSTLLPKLTAPCDYGAIIYDKKVDAHLGVGTFVTLVNGKTGELTLEANRSGTDEGQFGTITVTISTSNYQDITLTIHVSAKNRITPTGTPTLSKNAITYGNALNTIALSGKLHDNVNNVDVDGTFEWVDGTHIPVVGNGTYAAEWIFEPTDTEKYLTVSGRSNITVEKAQQYGKVSMDDYVYGETPSTPSLTDRTGDGSVTYYYTTTDSNSGGIKWENIQADTLNAGTYYMYAELGETENYGSFTTACVKFRVVRAMPTYTTPTGLTAIYGQTLADVTLPDGWSWMDSSESVGGASTAAKTFQARFTPTDAVNYNTVENIKLDVTVNKANGGSLKTVELTQKHTDTSEHTYTPDWAGLPAGQDWTFSSEASIVLPKQDFAAGGKLLTYAISSGTAGDKITLTLKASCDNYEDFTITLTITLTEKDDQKPLTITGAGSVVYGQTLTLTTTGGSGTGTVTYRIDTAHSTGEATIDPNTGVLTPAKVGSVSVVATKAGDNDYNDVTSAPFVLMIKPATPTGEPNYTKITTSGKTLKDAALTTKGSTLDPSDGNLEWVDDKGEPLPDDTTVKANTTYKWRFTPDDDNYTTLTGEVELYHKSSSDGGWYDSYYTIKATAGAGGSISPSGNVSVREGRDQTFTITPDKGYAVANVKIDGKSIGAVKSYTFENVSRTHTIEVIFMKANGNPQTGVFVDVATGSYYEDAVDWAVENGITKGTDDTHFSPDGICTRAQAVTFLWRTAGSPEPETRAMPFTDVPVGSYYYDAVLWAVENGITKGTSDTTFSPNMICSRAQIVAFLWRSEKSPAAGTANPFADVKSTAYYADAVLWAVKENITKGTTSTTFSPDADCTRAQIVTFLWRCKK